MNKQWCDAFPSSSVTFEKTEQDLVLVRVDNALASAKILLQGAQVLSFVPQGEQDLLWVSDDACYELGRPVRGGVPICWPWFGASSESTQAPAHGFARNLAWQLHEVKDLDSGATELIFTLAASDETAQWWPHPFELQYRVVVGRSLALSLKTRNVGAEVWRFTEALHSYLAVPSITTARLSGFSGLDYQDKLLTDTGLKAQTGDVLVAGEVDRIYQVGPQQATPRVCVLSDSGVGSGIKVASSGSCATVVWNPWIDKAKALADFSDEGYQTMLCVEAANTEPSPVSLQPGESHTLCQVLSLL